MSGWLTIASIVAGRGWPSTQVGVGEGNDYQTIPKEEWAEIYVTIDSQLSHQLLCRDAAGELVTIEYLGRRG